MLGGPTRSEILTYAHVACGASPDEYVANLRALVERVQAFVAATGARPRISVLVYNSIGADEFRTSPREAQFRAILAAAQLPSHRRYSGGSDVGAACGQLAARS